MADGLTAQQIINKRESDIESCETIAKAERQHVEGSMTLNLSPWEYAKGVFLFGPSGLKETKIVPIDQNERVCKATASLNADLEFGLSEARLKAEKTVLEGSLQGRSTILAATEKALTNMTGLLNKTLLRAKVAESAASSCIVEPLIPRTPHRQARRDLLATRKP